MSKVELAPPKTDEVIHSHTQNWSDEQKAQYADYISKQTLTNEPLMNERDHVIIDYGKGKSFINLRAGMDLRVRQTKAKADSLIKEPYHSVFALENKGLKRRLEGPVDISELFEHLAEKDDPNFLPSANNSELFDNGTENQTITQEEITRMKQEGKSGDEIIRAVAAASKTFDGKTEFSQAKWLKKKHAKYNTDVSTIRPTPSTILNTLFDRDDRKVLGMRDDTLAQLMNFANVGAGSHTLVVEGAGGLITGTVAYRQGGHGYVLSAHIGQQPNLSFVDDFNLDEASKAAIVSFPLSMLPGLSKQRNAGTPVTEDAEDMTMTPAQRTQRKARGLLYNKAHSLILATQFSPLELLIPLFDHLLPSSPFVVYSQYLEPLVRTQQYLIANRLGANIQVSECWYRHQQVLPNRTHPHMSMNATGGYILSGITIEIKQ